MIVSVDTFFLDLVISSVSGLSSEFRERTLSSNSAPFSWYFGEVCFADALRSGTRLGRVRLDFFPQPFCNQSQKSSFNALL